MRVKDRMTPNPITCTPKTTHREAMKLMQDHNIRRLPVLDDKGRLVGIVSDSDLLRTAPSEATTLSVFEIYTLLDKLTVGRIMTHPVMAVDETCGLASAAHYMVEHKIGSLPVMAGEKLVGIITETDIFKAFVEVMGGGEPGTRIDVRVPDEPGVLATIAKAIADLGANIVSVTTFEDADTSRTIVSIKATGGDEEKLRAALTGVEVREFRPSGQDCVLEFG
jgi:acetoin utilization protein AcuB